MEIQSRARVYVGIGSLVGGFVLGLLIVAASEDKLMGAFIGVGVGGTGVATGIALILEGRHRISAGKRHAIILVWGLLLGIVAIAVAATRT